MCAATMSHYIDIGSEVISCFIDEIIGPSLGYIKATAMGALINREVRLYKPTCLQPEHGQHLRVSLDIRVHVQY